MSEPRFHIDLLPFEPLLEQLKGLGFHIGVDTHVKIQHLLEKAAQQSTDADAIPVLKYKLATLLATSEDEQNQFYDLFDRYVDQMSFDPETVSEEDSPGLSSNWWPWINTVLIALILFAWYWFFVHSKKDICTTSAIEATFAQDVRTNGGFVQFSNAEDTASQIVHYQIYWRNHQDTTTAEVLVGEAFSSIFVAMPAGLDFAVLPEQKITLIVRRQQGGCLDSVRLRVSLTKPFPCRANIEQDRLEDGKSIRFRGQLLSTANDSPLTNVSFHWDFGSGRTADGAEPLHTYDKDSVYLLTLIASVASCRDTVEQSISIASEAQKGELPWVPMNHLPLDPIDVSDLVRPTTTNYWPLLATLLILLSWLALELFLYYRRKLRIDRRQALMQPPARRRLEMDTPGNQLFEDESFYLASRRLRIREIDESEELDVPQSIEESIRAGGIPKFAYRPNTFAVRYLVLIEQKSAEDHQAALVAELVAELRQRDITAEAWYYKENPAVCWLDPGQPESQTTLDRLLGEYGAYRLIVAGRAISLLDRTSGEHGYVSDLIQQWPYAALLATNANSDWGQPEAKVAERMLVLPAGLKGLAMLNESWSDDNQHSLRYWQTESFELSPPSEDDPDLIGELKAYLGRNAFQWLCACAVYPELYWEMTIELGGRLSEDDPDFSHRNERDVHPELSLDVCLRLMRLPWFRAGFIPNQVREKLIPLLEEPYASRVRRYLIEVLEAQPGPENSWLAQSRQQQKAIYLYLNSPHQDRDKYALKQAFAASRYEDVRDKVLLKELDGEKINPLSLVVPARWFKGRVPLFGTRWPVRLAMFVVPLLLGWAVYLGTGGKVLKSRSPMPPYGLDDLVIASEVDQLRWIAYKATLETESGEYEQAWSTWFNFVAQNGRFNFSIEQEDIIYDINPSRIRLNFLIQLCRQRNFPQFYQTLAQRQELTGTAEVQENRVSESYLEVLMNMYNTGSMAEEGEDEKGLLSIPRGFFQDTSRQNLFTVRLPESREKLTQLVYLLNVDNEYLDLEHIGADLGSDVDELYQRAEQAWKEDRLADAQSWLERLLHLVPNNERAKKLLERIEARYASQQAEILRNKADSLYILGNEKADIAILREAQKLYNQYLQLQPDDTQIRATAAEIDLVIRDIEGQQNEPSDGKSSSKIEKLMAGVFSEYQPLAEKGKLTENDAASVIRLNRLLEEVFKVEPDNGEALEVKQNSDSWTNSLFKNYLNLAQNYYEKGRKMESRTNYQKGLEAIKAALKLKPGDPGTLKREKELESRIQALDRDIAIWLKQANTAREQAEVLNKTILTRPQALVFIKQSRLYYEKVLKTDETNRQARSGLSMLDRLQRSSTNKKKGY
ncbi:MAG: PKD domain-containing protein [Bacteroidota bacterium]